MAKTSNKTIKYFDPETGFIPNTSREIMVKHYAKIIAEKQLDKVSVNHNVTIMIPIPVWPQRYKGSELKYYKKDGSWRYSYRSGVLLKNGDAMNYHNVPKMEDFLNDDYNDHHTQFLIIASSDPDKIIPGQVAYLQPGNKSVRFFKFNGVTIASASSIGLMFSIEV